MAYYPAPTKTIYKKPIIGTGMAFLLGVAATSGFLAYANTKKFQKGGYTNCEK